MFDLRCDLLIPGLVNLYSVLSVEWFLLDMKPLEDTSKQFNVHLKYGMSVRKCAYLLLFSVFLVSICFSDGHLSSNRCIVFLCLSSITISGFSAVTHSSGGIEPLQGQYDLVGHCILCRGSAIEHVLYFKCHRKYYNGNASENTTLAYNGISIRIYFKAPALECIFYDTWSTDIC